MAHFGQSPSPQGFYVFQTALGCPLQFHPSLGTPELDSLMDAYLPCPASMQEKRAAVSVDFLENYRCTGQSIKFYQVPDCPLPSSASSPSSLQDSGYGSSFTASPIAPTWSWRPTICSTSASNTSPPLISTTSQTSSRRHPRSTTHRSPASSHHQLGDFSHLPGMKILTRDGRDVTNSAPRGCKTKEQRDHAHLMRIIKACDSCRRKKVRCDPSHRSAGGVSLRPTSSSLRQTKKLRAGNNTTVPEASHIISRPETLVSVASPSPLPPSVPPPSVSPSADSPTPIDVFDPAWNEFASFGDPLLDPAVLDSFDVLPDPEAFIPFTGSQPSLTAVPFGDPGDLAAKTTLPSPTLPYLDKNDTPHYYTDFDLYSPRSSVPDVEPVFDTNFPQTSLPEFQQTDGETSDALGTQPPSSLVPRSSDHYVDRDESQVTTRVRSWVLRDASWPASSLISGGASANIPDPECLPTPLQANVVQILRETYGRQVAPLTPTEPTLDTDIYHQQSRPHAQPDDMASILLVRSLRGTATTGTNAGVNHCSAADVSNPTHSIPDDPLDSGNHLDECDITAGVQHLTRCPTALEASEDSCRLELTPDLLSTPVRAADPVEMPASSAPTLESPSDVQDMYISERVDSRDHLRKTSAVIAASAIIPAQEKSSSLLRSTTLSIVTMGILAILIFVSSCSSLIVPSGASQLFRLLPLLLTPTFSHTSRRILRDDKAVKTTNPRMRCLVPSLWAPVVAGSSGCLF